MTTTATTPITTLPTTTATGPAVTLDLVARGFAFDQTTITVPAGADVTINFTNDDGGVPHNFSLYTDRNASSAIYIGKIINGGSVVYQFTAPSTPGTYFFRCDLHPVQMTGSFIVQ